MFSEFKKISSTKKDLINFGRVIAGACAVVAVILALKGNYSFVIWAGIGVGVIIIRFAYPLILLPFQKLWMGISIVLGWLVSHLILCVLYYTGFTLIGGIGRLFRQKFLDVEFNSNRDSYWIRRDAKPADKKSYEKQY